MVDKYGDIPIYLDAGWVYLFLMFFRGVQRLPLPIEYQQNWKEKKTIFNRPVMQKNQWKSR